jgi:hypothetical protein
MVIFILQFIKYDVMFQKAIPLIRPLFHCRRGGLIREGLLCIYELFSICEF